MTWDKDIPAPTKQPKWDFENAEIGWSMAFQTREEANRFAIALRAYAYSAGKNWGASVFELPPVNHEVEGTIRGFWRVWIVEKRKRKSKAFEKISAALKDVVNGDFKVVSSDPFDGPLSTDTDDDIMLSTD